MSVYTTLTKEDFSSLLARYSVGELTGFEGIKAGIENTNYFVSTTHGEYVLTLFEIIQRRELDYYVSLLQKLSVNGIACPQPQHDIQHKVINEIFGKPFILVKRIQGSEPDPVSTEQCKAIATELARFHTASFSFDKCIVNRWGTNWLSHVTQLLSAFIPVNDLKLIKDELSRYHLLDNPALPRGIIHADLFTDNALFVENRLSGILDFYDACEDTLLLDVAITVNAWCMNPTGSLNQERYTAFIAAYQAIRPFSREEISLWNLMLRRAAMRFWLSRLEAKCNPRPGDLTQVKDPGIFKNILLFHIQEENQTDFKIKQLSQTCG